jgi:hypothetical protein
MNPSEQQRGCNNDCNQGRNCDCRGEDDVGAMRGLANGLLLAVPLWLLIMLAFYYLYQP